MTHTYRVRGTDNRFPPSSQGPGFRKEPGFFFCLFTRQAASMQTRRNDAYDASNVEFAGLIPVVCSISGVPTHKHRPGRCACALGRRPQRAATF